MISYNGATIMEEKEVKECIANALAKNKELYPEGFWSAQAGYLEGFLLSYVQNVTFEIKLLNEKIKILEEYKKLLLEHAEVENDQLQQRL